MRKAFRLWSIRISLAKKLRPYVFNSEPSSIYSDFKLRSIKGNNYFFPRSYRFWDIWNFLKIINIQDES